MADALTGKTQVDATIQDIVAAQFQQVLNANLVAAQAVTQYAAGPGMDTLKIPKLAKFTVSDASNPVDAQTQTLATDDLVLDKYEAIQFLVRDIAKLQSAVEFVSSFISQAAIDMATAMDAHVITKIEAASAAAPDHRIAYANSGTDNNLGKADILESRKLLNSQNVPLADRFAVISPSNEKAILSINEFVKANEVGSDAAVRNGEIGKLLGFTVLITSQAADLKSLFFHKSHVAFGRQMLPKMEMQRDLVNLADRWSLSHLYGAKTLDGGKRGVLSGTAA